MYCKVCGSATKENAEICVACGCRPLNGNEYCQECGVKTTEKQEMCVKCGCMLKKSSRSFTNSFTNDFTTTFSSGIGLGDSKNEKLNLDFSDLSPYYQQEFRKIYESGEVYKGKFNIFGLLFGAFWALTKGLTFSALIVLISSVFSYGIIAVVYWFIYGFRGNYMYYCSYVKGKQCLF